MKLFKKIMTMVTLLSFLASSAYAAVNSTKGWDDCPRKKSCTTPQCRLWIDTNKNKICDHGEKALSSKMSSMNSTDNQTNFACHICIGCGACGNA